MSRQQARMLAFTGAEHFRHRLVLATLSGKPIVIKEIRPAAENPGLQEYEASFLRLLDKLTNGCKIVINVTGTAVSYTPGVIVGGKLVHDCGTSRAIGYFLEGVLPLAPFSKQPFQLTLQGVTNDDDGDGKNGGGDIAVDTIRSVTLPLLQRFGVERSDSLSDATASLQLRTLRRGFRPNAGGEVFFSCPVVRAMQAVDLRQLGPVSRVRGVLYSCRVPQSTLHRVIDQTKAALRAYVTDVHLFTDHDRGSEAQSPGYGLTMAAESSEGGAVLSADGTAAAGELPDAFANRIVDALLAEIANNGYVDTVHQWVPLLFMALAPENVSRLRVGKLSPYTIEFLRLMREFFGVVFKADAEPETGTVLLTVVGIGYRNVAKRAM